MTMSGPGGPGRLILLLAGTAVAGGLVGCAASTRPAERGDAAQEVTCDVHTCTLTLRTSGPREVRAFGATLSLDGVEGGAADLTVGNAQLRCTPNTSVEAGPLSLFCDDVTPDSVTLTAEVG